MAVKVSFPAPSLFFWAIDLGVHACADIRYAAKGVGTSRWPRRMGYVSGNMPGRRYMGMIVGKLQMEQWVHSHREREGKKHDTNRTRDRWSMRNIQDRSFPGGYLGSFRLRTPTGTFFFLAMHHQEVCEALSFSFYALVLFSFRLLFNICSLFKPSLRRSRRSNPAVSTGRSPINIPHGSSYSKRNRAVKRKWNTVSCRRS